MRKIILFLIFFLLTAFLYSQQNFRDSKFHFKPDVIDFRDDGIVENIRSNVLITPSLKDLKVGSIFIGPDGAARKVVYIYEEGNNVRIRTVTPELREIFYFYDIPEQTIEFSHGDMSPIIQASSRAGFEVEKKLNDYASVYAKMTNTPKLNIGGKLPYIDLVKVVEKVWKFWKWFSKSYWKETYHSGWAKAGIYLNSQLTVGLKIEYSKDKKSTPKDIPIYGFSVGDGIKANLGLFATAEIEGKITLDLPITFNMLVDVGGKCDLDGIGIAAVPNNFQRWNTFKYYPVTFNPSLTMSGEVRLKLYLGCKADLFGVELFETQIGTGPYLGIEGKLSGWVKFDRVTKQTGTKKILWFNFPVYTTTNEITHGFGGSLSGEIGLFVNGYIEFFQEKIKVTFLDEKYPIYKFLDVSFGEQGNVVSGEFISFENQNYDILPQSIINRDWE